MDLILILRGIGRGDDDHDEIMHRDRAELAHAHRTAAAPIPGGTVIPLAPFAIGQRLAMIVRVPTGDRPKEYTFSYRIENERIPTCFATGRYCRRGEDGGGGWPSWRWRFGQCVSRAMSLRSSA